MASKETRKMFTRACVGGFGNYLDDEEVKGVQNCAPWQQNTESQIHVTVVNDISSVLGCSSFPQIVGLLFAHIVHCLDDEVVIFVLEISLHNFVNS